MINAIDNDKISHAYLFDLNDNFKAIDMIMDFVKAIIRSQDYSDASDEEFNNISKRIDDGNYIEIKVIEPDGIWIKKEQLRELQDEFSRVGIEGKTRLYIIKDADKMNVQSANSILKFLEEPVENIVAILITNNMNKMLSTIVSRCQLICFNNKIDKCYDRAYLNLINNSEVKFLNDEDECKEFVRTIIGFIDYYEENGIDAIVYSKKLWHTSFNDRDKVILAIDLMINFYYDVLLLKNEFPGKPQNLSQVRPCLRRKPHKRSYCMFLFCGKHDLRRYIPHYYSQNEQQPLHSDDQP